MSTTMADLVRAQRATGVEIASLRAEIRALGDALRRAGAVPGRPLRNDDRALLRTLLPVIRQACEDNVWTAASLAELACLPACTALADVLAVHVNRGASLQRFGKFLARVEGHELDGWRLVRCGADRCGQIWQVVRV